ncbi:alpha/beta fold hydrolase [Flavobacteriaceae bacterium AH-315-B10]|nr:alpha/beta fold hydrolase [Flavobacteriaceae bacterium AH-315-B10]
MQLHSTILGQGQPLIILHGFLGMSNNWKSLGKKFSNEGFEVHLIDQRNHGRSFRSDIFNFEVLIEDLKRYCEEYNLKNIILLGHSMGGKTAMLFATQYPKMVSKLIVADIAPRYYPKHHESILEGLSALDFKVIKSRNEADFILANYVSEFSKRQFLLKNLYWKDKGELDLRINLNALKENVEEIGKALPTNSKFNGKTLFLRGDKSDYIALKDEALIKEHFPKATLGTISNAGHWLHAENPKDFFEEVLRFVK